jgi:hypothetical protein
MNVCKHYVTQLHWQCTPSLSPSEGERGNRRQVSGKPKLVGREHVPQVLIVSGTGSGCYGKALTGNGVKVGGWGHVLGDKGSGYDIGLPALEAVIDRLNMFTTLAIVRIGKVRSNLMIDMSPANVKLRDRAVRIVQSLTGADYFAAQRALERNGWGIKRTLTRPGWK